MPRSGSRDSGRTPRGPGRVRTRFIEREEHVHTHEWRDGDILFWDNRQVIHMASSTPPGQASVSYRIGVYDGLPFYTNDPSRVAAG